jgi:hypothetical protein
MKCFSPWTVKYHFPFARLQGFYYCHSNTGNGIQYIITMDHCDYIIQGEYTVWFYYYCYHYNIPR